MSYKDKLFFKENDETKNKKKRKQRLENRTKLPTNGYIKWLKQPKNKVKGFTRSFLTNAQTPEVSNDTQRDITYKHIYIYSRHTHKQISMHT